MCRGLPSSVDLLSKLVPRPCPRSHAPEWRLRTIATDGDWVRGRVACCERLGVSHLLVDTRFVQTFNCNHWAVRFALKQPHWETVMLPAGQTSTSPLGVQPHRLQSPRNITRLMPLIQRERVRIGCVTMPCYFRQPPSGAARFFAVLFLPAFHARLKYWMSFSCFSAAALVLNVPRFLRFPVFGFFLREYSR